MPLLDTLMTATGDTFPVVMPSAPKAVPDAVHGHLSTSTILIAIAVGVVGVLIIAFAALAFDPFVAAVVAVITFFAVTYVTTDGDRTADETHDKAVQAAQNAYDATQNDAMRTALTRYFPSMHVMDGSSVTAQPGTAITMVDDKTNAVLACTTSAGDPRDDKHGHLTTVYTLICGDSEGNGQHIIKPVHA